jgi:hypothetical protein
MSHLQIDDQVSYRGRRYLVAGFEPMSCPNRLVDLVDAASGAVIRIPTHELEQPAWPRRVLTKRPSGVRRPAASRGLYPV